MLRKLLQWRLGRSEDTPAQTLKLNNKGFTLTELIIVMVILGVLFAVGIVGRSVYIERAKVTNLRSDFNNYENPLQQCLLENPTIGRLTDKQAQLDLINSYLAEEMKFAPADGGPMSGDFENLYSAMTDPWDMPYQLWITMENNENTPTPTTHAATDTEVRIYVTCWAKNNKSTDVASTIDNDDKILVIQMVNGDVKTASYGLGKEKGAFAFASDTDKTTLVGAYSK